MPDRRRVGERVVDLDHMRANQSEDMLDALGLEGLDDRRAAALSNQRRVSRYHLPFLSIGFIAFPDTTHSPQYRRTPGGEQGRVTRHHRLSWRQPWPNPRPS
jgi:hypothetical protein